MSASDGAVPGRIVLVTGGSRGIGRAIVETLVGAGARVVLCALDEDSLRQAADALDAGDRVIAVPGDLSDAGLGARLAGAAVGRFGRIDGALVSVGGPAAG